MPSDTFPDDPDGTVAEVEEAQIVPLSPKSGNAPRSPRSPRAGAGAKSPGLPAAVDAAPNPGPPPPLPPDLVSPAPEGYPADIVIPPRPPLPVPPATTADQTQQTDTAPELEAHVEVSEPFVSPGEDDEDEAAIEPDTEWDRGPTAAATAAALTATQTSPEPVLDVVALDEPEANEITDPFAASVVLEEAVSTAPAALMLRGVSKRFGDTRAVDGIDLTVPAGTFYGLVGPNGAGKTTTLSLISGLLRPDSGSIHVGGIDARTHATQAKRLMGVLPDRLRTFDRLTGRQLLYYYGVLRGLPSATVESRIADLARAFDLADALGRTTSDYSAGMVKKVMLAGALIHSPRLLVLDEPFESVDPVSGAVILDILSAYVAHGGTVILSSHGMELVERVCTRVAVMVAGQVLAEGTVDEVRGELTLEQRFVELAGGLSDVEGLEWLHTFSD